MRQLAEDFGRLIQRYIFHTIAKETVQLSGQYDFTAERAFLAFPSMVCGANLPDNQKELTLTIRKAVQGELRGNQIRLLLRGDPNYAGRAAKVSHEPHKLKALTLETAKRYHLQLAGMKLPSSEPASLSSTSPKISSAKTGTPQQAPPPPRLDPLHWSEKPMESFQLGIRACIWRMT